MDEPPIIPYYVVQTFTEVEGRLVPDMPLDASCASEAATLALAFRSCKAGVIAFEWSGEMPHRRHAPPFVLAWFGRLPEECLAWIRTDEVEKTSRKKPPIRLRLIPSRQWRSHVRYNA
jgi:hypothetical protein